MQTDWESAVSSACVDPENESTFTLAPEILKSIKDKPIDTKKTKERKESKGENKKK